MIDTTMKIFCIGRNYAEHAKELNNEIPEEPVIFMKPPTALLRDNQPFYIPEFTQDVHYEVELVLRISKNGKSIPMEFASRYYDEIGLGIDFTARDIQSKCKAKGLPWEKAKAFDHSAVISPFLQLADLPNRPIRFYLEKNGQVVQSGLTDDMLFNFDQLITHISKYFTLQQGDLIYTGTPSGVGPISIGDTLKGFIEQQQMFECHIK
jgi:acylpyruvate hydrolase